MQNDQERIRHFAQMLAKAEHLVVLTGAGVSKESGVPTFRDALEGLWAQHDPTQLATPQAFRSNPKLVWDWYQYRRELLANAAPNPGHYALAELEDLLPQVVIVTQNVDGFHYAAGSTDVVCLHGDLTTNKCFDDCQGQPTPVDISQLEDYDPDDGPPICPFCQKAYVRPNVVWFNETLPPDEIFRAERLAQTADVMLVVGTSGLVYPAAILPVIAKQRGAKILEINPDESTITAYADLYLDSASGVALPDIVHHVRQLKTDS